MEQGEVFGLSNCSDTIVADRAGELFFAVNDKTTSAEIGDNLGNYEVSVGRY